MGNQNNFYEVVVKRGQYFRFPIAVANGISKEDALSAIGDFDLEGHVENECSYADTDVELIDFLEADSSRSICNVTEDTFRRIGYSTDGALITFISKDEDGGGEVKTEEYRKITHSHLLFDDELTAVKS